MTAGGHAPPNLGVCAMIRGMPTPTSTQASPIVLQAQPLSASAMAPYGWVLDIEQALGGQAGRAINSGTSRRADVPGELALNAGNGRPLACVFRAQAQAPQGPWRMLERHRLGTQSFVPLGGDAPAGHGAVACLLLVALGDVRPQEDTLRAFWVHPKQAFTLKTDTWHHPLIATHDRDFLVIERTAPQVDCEVVSLVRPVTIQWP